MADPHGKARGRRGDQRLGATSGSTARRLKLRVGSPLASLGRKSRTGDLTMADVIRLLEVVLPPLVTLILGIWGGKVHERRSQAKKPKAPAADEKKQ